MVLSTFTGVPVVGQQKWTWLVPMRMRIRSLVLLRVKDPALPWAVVWVADAAWIPCCCGCGVDLTPSLGTSICAGVALKSKTSKQTNDEPPPKNTFTLTLQNQHRHPHPELSRHPQWNSAPIKRQLPLCQPLISTLLPFLSKNFTAVGLTGECKHPVCGLSWPASLT